jgi:hypothetical protein
MSRPPLRVQPMSGRGVRFLVVTPATKLADVRNLIVDQPHRPPQNPTAGRRVATG